MALIFFSIEIFSQDPILKIESTGLCQSDTATVPLNSMELNNVGAITLYINFHSGSVKFKGIANIHPLLKNGLMYNSTVSPPRISIVWSSATGINLGNSKLLDMIFELSDTSAMLVFSKDSCEIANAAVPPEILNVAYFDGEIFESTPSIVTQPDNRSIAPGNNCIFSIETYESTGFRWWESRDVGVSWNQVEDGGLYSGASTRSLFLANVPDSYDGYIYRCEVQRDKCKVDSKSATLKVGPQYMVEDLDPQTFSIGTKPNPFIDKLSLSVYTLNPGNLELEFFSLDRKCILKRQIEIGKVGLNEFELNIVSLPIGLTLCNYKFITKGVSGYNSGVLEVLRVINR